MAMWVLSQFVHLFIITCIHSYMQCNILYKCIHIHCKKSSYTERRKTETKGVAKKGLLIMSGMLRPLEKRPVGRRVG